jgi:peptidyl-tRNA hydrolase
MKETKTLTVEVFRDNLGRPTCSKKALEAGLMSYLIEDNGATEFGGIKTATCVAIGPHYDERFEEITDNLPLL